MAEKDVKIVEVNESKLLKLRSLTLDSLALAHVCRLEVDQCLSNGFLRNCRQRFIQDTVTKSLLVWLGFSIIGAIVSLIANSDRILALCIGITIITLIALAVVAIISIVGTTVKTRESHKIRQHCDYFYESGWEQLSTLDNELGITRASSEKELIRRINEEM